MQLKNYGIIWSSETWLHDYHVDLYNIGKYTGVHNHIFSKQGGGVAL